MDWLGNEGGGPDAPYPFHWNGWSSQRIRMRQASGNSAVIIAALSASPPYGDHRPCLVKSSCQRYSQAQHASGSERNGRINRRHPFATQTPYSPQLLLAIEGYCKPREGVAVWVRSAVSQTLNVTTEYRVRVARCKLDQTVQSFKPPPYCYSCSP